jgi:hypothetical protein
VVLQVRQLRGGIWYTFFLFVYFLLAFYEYLVKQGTLAEGAQYYWPPSTIYFRSGAFISKILFIFLQNNLPEWGGQLYRALPLSKFTLVQVTTTYRDDVLAKDKLNQIGISLDRFAKNKYIWLSQKTVHAIP